MQCAAAPNNPALERQAKAIIADHFDNPAVAFQIAELALSRDALLEVPKLLGFQQQLEAELFAKRRIAMASAAELGFLWKRAATRSASAQNRARA